MKIVSFETAKLAKEKGFSIGCDWQYDEFGNIVDGLYMPHYFKAPCQYQLMDWLREEHGFLINIRHRKGDGFGYSYRSLDGTTENLHFDRFSDYYKCLERALQKILNLI